MKYISLRLSAVIAVSVLLAIYSAPIFSSDIGTPAEGTLGSPYDTSGFIPVGTAYDLSRIGSGDPYADGRTWSLSERYVLTNDIRIDADHAVFTDGNFDPIGYPAGEFTGILAGGGHEISGLNVIVSEPAYTGLFRCLGSNAQIRDLRLTDGSFSGVTHVGSIAGLVSGSGVVIENCRNRCDISSAPIGEAFVGGLFGHVISTDMTIKNCRNEGSVTVSTSSMAGGLIGYFVATSAVSVPGLAIEGCSNAGTVTITTSSMRNTFAAGLIGFSYVYTNLALSRCYNEGEITIVSDAGDAYSGGLLGNIYVEVLSWNALSDAVLSIKDCYNTGKVSSSGAAVACSGGIISRITPFDHDPFFALSTISNCYSIGQVTASVSSGNRYSGGIIGYAQNTTQFKVVITNCYYLNGTANRLCGTYWGFVTDGTDDRESHQASGVKSQAQMQISLAEARGGGSVYYTGSTETPYSETVGGWDFFSIWTIIDGVNNGYPIFVPYPMTVSGTVTDGTDGIEGVAVSYTVNGYPEEPVLTDAYGNYHFSVPLDSTVAVTGVTKEGYTVNGAMPPEVLMTCDVVLDFTMSKDVTGTDGPSYPSVAVMILIAIFFLIIVDDDDEKKKKK